MDAVYINYLVFLCNGTQLSVTIPYYWGQGCRAGEGAAPFVKSMEDCGGGGAQPLF